MLDSTLTRTLTLSLAMCTLAHTRLQAQANMQTVFQISLDGGQHTPPVSTAQSGFGWMFLDPVTRVLRYDIQLTGVTGSAVVATLHHGNAGQAGPAIQALSLSGSTLSGETPPLSPAQMFALTDGDLYASVASTAFPNGELRGQITDTRAQWAAYLEPYKVVPASSSTGSGTAEFVYDAGTQTIGVHGSSSGLSGAISSVAIRAGDAFTNGPMLFTVPTTSTSTFAGTLPPLSAQQLAAARSGDWYLEITTLAHPNGEVRGAIVGSLLEYGDGCPGPNGEVRLSATGLPSPGGMIHGVVEGGNPNNPVLIFRSLQGGSLPVGYGCLLFTQPPIAPPVAVSLDGNGRIDIAKPIATTVVAPCWVSAQIFGFDPGAPNGFLYATNGLMIGITD